MDFTKVIETRRSIRSYQPRDIAPDVLERILKAAIAAPTGSDKQTWHLCLVKSPEVRDRLGTEGTTQHFIKDAPVIAVCVAETRYRTDAIIAIDHLVLAARNEGIGTCWVGFFDGEKVKEILGVPADQDVVMLVPMGYPADPAAFCLKEPRARLEDSCTEK
ncbi:MAG: nitroreductase [Lentisphaerae bacterium]|jgi:nitroreductase|nr:nitroreductase [Lentisphaerota bacterium]MBT4819569.1 nitroreductase [Lentisphaerota bacterium]MBT5607098.1 nitroreductase [Lentisphaerota bacterium]MBT7059229.1 nitroreductase [Lentisphaerota bacterium]MBT7846578.1 nitroreductase [Lentisphaerota bacterium]